MRRWVSMTPLRVFLHRLRGLFSKRAHEQDFEEEIRFHLEMQNEDHLRAGMTQEDARQAALRKFGGVMQTREAYRDRRGFQIMSELFQDFRYGLRMLGKSPGWTLIMGAMLALGVGLSTAIFSLSHGVLRRALPYPDADRLVGLSLGNTVAAAAGYTRFSVNSANWMDWREQSKTFEDIALTRNGVNYNLTGDGPAERVIGARATWNLTQTLGVEPMLGRMFTEEETRRDAKIAILSYGFWDRRFARDPKLIGRSVQLNGELYEVVGVTPPGFRYPTQDFELWTPLYIPPAETRSKSHFYYHAVGRLKPGVTFDQARAELTGITQRLSLQYPRGKDSGEDGVWVDSLVDFYVGEFRTNLYILLASVGSLLLLSCINLSGLLIVRGNARAREYTIRAALGAGAERLRRQTLAESLPLGVLGCLGGAFLAWAALKILVPWLPSQATSLGPIGLSGSALGMAVLLSFLVVLIAGMLPARMASRVRLAGMMHQDPRTMSGGGLIRNSLVIAQIAVTLALVFAGGLLARSLASVFNVNPGFKPQQTLTMHMEASQAKFPTAGMVAEYYQQVVRQLKSIPGVTEAGFVNRLPFTGGAPGGPVEFEGLKNVGFLTAEFRFTTPGYFIALGIPLIQGRDFTEFDKEGSTPVVVIDEQLARKVFGNESPLGKRVKFGVITDRTPWQEIVGVVGHIRGGSLETDPRPQIYWPCAQLRTESQQSPYHVALVARTAGRPESFASAIVGKIQAENPEQAVYDIRSMGNWLDRSLKSRTLLTGFVALFVGSALLLASLGLYGVVSYETGLRLREFATRSALGAAPGDLRRLVLSYSLRLWVAGASIGLATAWPIGRALKSQLYGVGSADAFSLTLAPALLLVIALLAALGPALRAGRIDPAATLRSD
jgi:predicted permease